MILLQLLEHDYYKQRTASKVPLWLETPVLPHFFPCLVSSSRPEKFLVSRKPVQSEPNGPHMIRSGLFEYSSDRIDEILPSMAQAAYDLSVSEKWNNIFDSPRDAFDYVQNQSGEKLQPHTLLVPSDWSETRLRKWSNRKIQFPLAKGAEESMLSVPIYNKTCRVLSCSVPFPVFFSRPTYVGVYTQFASGVASIVLHNIRLGMAFCNGVR